jgi:flagellar protein FliS
MWKDAYLDNRVLQADPIELVHILYEHTVAMVDDARGHLAVGNIPARGRAIARAIAAIDELDKSLDRQSGGSISRNLAGLYQYMRMRLVAANIRQEDAPLREVDGLLRTLAEGWNGIRHSELPVKSPRDMHSLGSFEAEPQTEYAVQSWSA